MKTFCGSLFPVFKKINFQRVFDFIEHGILFKELNANGLLPSVHYKLVLVIFN